MTDDWRFVLVAITVMANGQINSNDHNLSELMTGIKFKQSVILIWKLFVYELVISLLRDKLKLNS